MLSVIISYKRSVTAMLLKKQLLNHWFIFLNPFVLESDFFNSKTFMIDRNQTVSRRSKPSSRTTLIGEQPNPWDLLQPQDVMSRHRGAKHPRRYGLLEGISLLSPAYLLSVERWPFHSEPPDHYDRLSTLLDLSVSQSGRLMPLHSTNDFWPFWAYLRTPPLLFGRRPPQSNYPPYNVLQPDYGMQLDVKNNKRGISLVTPLWLTPKHQSLPPMLNISFLTPI